MYVGHIVQFCSENVGIKDGQSISADMDIVIQVKIKQPVLCAIAGSMWFNSVYVWKMTILCVI